MPDIKFLLPTNLEELMIIFKRAISARYLIPVLSFHYDIYHNLCRIKLKYPERYKRIEAAFNLEDFESIDEMAIFLRKLMKSTSRCYADKI